MAETEDQATKPELDAPAVTLSEPEGPKDPVLTTPAAKKPQRRGFAGPFLGGVLAAGAGFGLAQYVPDGWPMADTGTLQSALDAQAREIAALKDQLVQTDALAGRVTALEIAPPAANDQVMEALADLTTRVAALESLPSDSSPAAMSTLTDAVRKLRADLDAVGAAGPSENATALAAEAEARLKEAEAQATAMKAEAEALARTAASRAAVGRLLAALDSGQPFAAALPEIGAEVPEALSAFGQTGLPTLGDLQKAFAPAARAALDAALRADMGETWTERLGSFLRSQTGARSLTPRDGTDPDAVLSRAEAALASGDLGKTLQELAIMPEVSQSALADWRALAEQRLAAEAAIQAIAAKIGE